MTNIFLELTLILILAGGIATIISWFKQPPIIAYIITGLLVGPFGYYHLHNTEILHGLGQVGITLLLFLVGLELDIAQLKKLGTAALLAAIGQVALTFAAGLGLLYLLGFTGIGATLAALALSFSSTVITVKLLNEKRDINSLYGKLALAILLLQDFAAIGLLIFLAGKTTGGSPTAMFDGTAILFTLAKALVLAWLINWASTYLFPRILKGGVGKSDELLLVFSLAWALGLAAFVSLPFIGFSLEIGGFLAGLALARSAVHYEINARIKTLRDFFIIIFFIILGAGFSIDNLSSIIVPSIIIALFVILIKPVIIMFLLGSAGYKPRTAFMSGMSLGHISEFSLVVVTLGLTQGYFSQSMGAIITLAAIISIAVSSYLIIHAEALYGPMGFIARLFDFRKGSAERAFDSKDMRRHVIVVGAHRLGKHIVEVLRRTNMEFIIVDQNPDVTEEYTQQGVPAICGDINDDHIQDLAGIARARLIISTIPPFKENSAFVRTMKKNNYKAQLIMVAHDEEEARNLYEQGIDYALLPHFIGGQHMAKILEDDQHLKSLRKLRAQDLKTMKG